MSGDDSGAGDAAQAGGEAAEKIGKGVKKAAKTAADVGRVIASGGTDVKAWLNLAKTLAPIIIGFVVMAIFGVAALFVFFFGGGSAANASTCEDAGPTSISVLATNGPVNVGSPYTYPSSPPSQGTISAEMMGYAQLITRIALERNPPAPENAIMIAIATALVESKLSNPTVATDHDSLGLFQQRPSQGWGSPEQVTDPNYSVNKFLDVLLDIEGWNTVYSPGGAAQKVQGSAHPDRYDAVMSTAAGLVQSILPVIQVGVTTEGTTDPAAPSVSQAYILGDSITVGAKDLYTQMFTRQGAETNISAVVGRSWNTPGNPSSGSVGTTGTGKEAVGHDHDKIRDATIIVIALGTNGGVTSNPPEEIVKTIHEINPTAPIYWVNIAGTAPTVTPHVHPMNEKLEQLDLAGFINVVDWAATVDPGNVGTHDPQGLLSDGIHPTVPEGRKKLVDIVEFTFAALQGIEVSECEDYTGGNGGDPSDCPPDTFFNPTTLRVSQSAHELCVKSVQLARSPEAGKAIIWAFHHVGIPYGRPDGVCSTNTTRTGPDHYDCSGFSTSAYSQTGTDVGGNPTTSTMRGSWPQAFRVTEAQARPGDFYLPSTGHVTLLLADGNIIHSSKCGDVSHIRTLYSGNYNGYYAITTPTMSIL